MVRVWWVRERRVVGNEVIELVRVKFFENF